MKVLTAALAAALALGSFAGRALADETPAPSDSDAKKEARDARVQEVEGETEVVQDPTLHFNFTNVHYSGLDEFGGTFGDGKEKLPNGRIVDEEEPMSPPFVFMLINFGILLVILGKYGAPAARKLAESRHDEIKGALDEAAKLRDDAKAKLTEYETRIKDVDKEIAALVDGIRADAEADKQRILAAAAAQAAAMKKDAEQRIAAEIELARAQLTREVTAAAIAATEQLVKDKATADDQRKLVATFIANVGGAS